MLAKPLSFFQCCASPEKLITFSFSQGSMWNHQMLYSRSQQVWMVRSGLHRYWLQGLSMSAITYREVNKVEKAKILLEIYDISSVCISTNCKTSMANDSFYSHAYRPMGWQGELNLMLQAHMYVRMVLLHACSLWDQKGRSQLGHDVLLVVVRSTPMGCRNTWMSHKAKALLIYLFF